MIPAGVSERATELAERDESPFAQALHATTQATARALVYFTLRAVEAP